MLVKKKGLRAFLKRTFNARKWNETKTRKKMLIFSIFLVICYTLFGFFLLWLEKAMDSTLTTEYFGFAKWLVVSGVTITLADKTIDAVKYFKNNVSEEDNEEDGE